MHRKPSGGFTIIELLVVVTIIAVLLALLTPAMDKAIYEAEMVECGANLKAMGQGVMIYTADFKRFYPYRKTVGGTRLMGLNRKGDATYDVRPAIKDYMPISKMLNDPFCERIDLESELDRTNYAGYALWFGWRIAGNKGMNRRGDALEYGTDKFNILACDMDEFDYAVNQVFNSHPDNPATTRLLTRATNDDTLSWWYSSGGVALPTDGPEDGARRGKLDSNFLYDDTSVVRIDEIKSHTQTEPDDRFISLTSLASENATWRFFLPK